MKKPEILGANLIACAIACGPAAAVWVSAGAAAKTGGMVAVAMLLFAEFFWLEEWLRKFCRHPDFLYVSG